MDARIDHVTDSRDTRPAFGIIYRRYSDTCSSHVRIQEDSIEHAMRALTECIGNTHYVVLSIRQEVPQAQAAKEDTEAEEASDADVIRAFETKANEIAKANGWTIAHAETVMLRYLRDTSPDEAATIAAALQRRRNLVA